MKAASFYNCPYFPSQSLVFTFIKKMFNFSIHPNSKYQLASLVLTKKIQCLVQKQKKLTSHFPFPAVQVIVIKMYILDKEDILNSTYNQSQKSQNMGVYYISYVSRAVWLTSPNFTTEIQIAPTSAHERYHSGGFPNSQQIQMGGEREDPSCTFSLCIACLR